jgi:hypothetical protein
MKKQKLLGILLIILGIVVFISSITPNILKHYHLWSTNDSCKADEFPTFSAYLWNFSKGAFVISFVLGSIPCYLGVTLLRKTA